MIAYIEDGQLTAKKLLREGALSGGTVIDSADGGGSSPFIAATDGGYLAGWEVPHSTAASAVRVARLDANGAITDGPSTVALSGLAGMYPALATGGSAGDLVYARLHDDETYGASMRIFLRRLGEAGRSRSRAVRH